MSLTGSLFFAAGLIHNILGIISPRLREPLLRIVADGGTVVTPNNDNERYARENTFWFQFAGIALMIHGLHVRHLALQIKDSKSNKEDYDDEETNPSWLSWVVFTTGTIGAYCKPISGFHMIYVQGLRLLWIQYYGQHQNNNKKKKGLDQGK